MIFFGQNHCIATWSSSKSITWWQEPIAVFNAPVSDSYMTRSMNFCPGRMSASRPSCRMLCHAPMSAMVKVFRCGPRREVEAWRAGRPALANLPRKKPRGFGRYLWGKRTAGGWYWVRRGACGLRSWTKIAPRGGEEARSAGCDGLAARARVVLWETGRTGVRPVPGGNRWWVSQGDVHRVMRRPSVVERGSSAARRAGRSRRSALARRSRDRARAG